MTSVMLSARKGRRKSGFSLAPVLWRQGQSEGQSKDSPEAGSEASCEVKCQRSAACQARREMRADFAWRVGCVFAPRGERANSGRWAVSKPESYGP